MTAGKLRLSAVLTKKIKATYFNKDVAYNNMIIFFLPSVWSMSGRRRSVGDPKIGTNPAKRRTMRWTKQLD
jgi:hypothetical protein